MGLANAHVQHMLITDARSKVAATGNAVLGKGTESEYRYGASVVFLDIANIHAVRLSSLTIRALTSMCMRRVRGC